jgi:hypothetical protein
MNLTLGTFIDGYRRCNEYIVEKQPRPNEQHDFWMLVYEQDVRCIVAMDDVLATGQVSASKEHIL